MRMSILSPLISESEYNGNERIVSYSSSLDYVRLRIYHEEKELLIGWHINTGYSVIETHVRRLIGIHNRNFKLKSIQDHKIFELNDLVSLTPGIPIDYHLILDEGWTEELNGESGENWGRLRILNGFRSNPALTSNVLDKKEFNNFVTDLIDELCCLDTGVTWFASERVILNCIRCLCALIAKGMAKIKLFSEESDPSQTKMFILCPFFFFFILSAYCFSVFCYDTYRRMLSLSRKNMVEYMFSESTHEIAKSSGFMVCSLLGALFTYFIVSHLIHN
mmetsp:Transcript_10073/g.13193  ORF Transcript_10073/g.13193 Transcript_10073/m.13193 type:complete len:277 (+) Transcript_10073:63-893(+)